MKGKLIVSAAAIFLVASCTNSPSTIHPSNSSTHMATSSTVSQVKVLTIDSTRWPNISQHTINAQLAGKSVICTLDRAGATARRTEALRNVPTRSGFDRDEYPPAVCREGGRGADVQYIPSSENRSEGAWLESQIRPYADGTVVEIKVSK